MHKKLLLTSVLLLLLVKISGQSKEKIIDDYFNALVKNQQFSGNVLVVDRNKIVYERSFGLDYITKKTNTPDITFPLPVSQKYLQQLLFCSSRKRVC
jgi:hypothetical protein